MIADNYCYHKHYISQPLYNGRMTDREAVVFVPGVHDLEAGAVADLWLLAIR